jgi:hypothetical protein
MKFIYKIKGKIKNKYLNILLILSFFDFNKLNDKKKYFVLVYCVDNNDSS